METKPEGGADANGDLKPARILISYPEENYSRFLALNLQDAGPGQYEFVQVHTVADTIAALDQMFDVIISTIIYYSGGTGADILQAIRKRGITTPVILVTAAIRPGQEEEAKEATGVFGCMVPTVSLKQMKAMLDSAIASSRKQSANH